MAKVSEVYPDLPVRGARAFGSRKEGVRYLWYVPADGLGEQVFDLYQCVRYCLAYWGQKFGDYESEYTLEFFALPGGKWVKLEGDMWGDPDRPVMGNSSTKFIP